MPAFRRFRALLMPYDIYERHAVVARLLFEAGLEKNATVLDVGGCSALLGQFMPCRVLSINPDARGDLVGSGAALPFLGSAGHEQSEKRLNDLYRSAFDKPHAFLAEHVRYGLPNIVELERLAGALTAVNTRCYFAGDYVWQGRQFEQAIKRGGSSGGLFDCLAGFYARVAAWALFHPIQLKDKPQATTNRFYLLIAR